MATVPATILLVDDRDANLLALEAVLEPLRQRLVKVKSGREALRFLLQEDCSLILLDVNMPDLDGFETAALIRERERTRYTPIIFVTAVRREEEHIIKGYANGAVDYVVKPFAPETMIAKVTVFLEQHRREQMLRQEAALLSHERDEMQRREALARAEADAHREQLYALFMKAPAAIAVLSGEDLMFALANPHFEQLLGRTELTGRAGREAIPEPEAGPTWDLLQDVYRTGNPYLGNEFPALFGRSGDGGPRYFNFVAQPTKDGHGAVSGVMLHAVEITAPVVARRKTETLAKHLLDTDRGKNEFLAMLSHELRNPLAPILAALHIMRLRTNDPATSRERAVIERQVNHLSRLVDDLLDVSRATMGKIDLRRESLDLSTAVNRAVEIARPLIDEKKHTLTVMAPVGALFVDGDVVRLAQVLANLLHNAAKYADAGGQIAVSPRREGPEIVVRVRDNGRGIPPDRLNSVFELFVQGDQPVDRSMGGLGLGLTLVRVLVQLHGGSAEARSEGVGTGTEFIVRLPPLEDALKPQESVPPAPAPATRRRRILIVDDNLDAATMLSA